MNIRPIGPTARPSQAVSTPAADDTLERVAQDVLDAGVEIRAKRRWWFGTRKLDAAETAEKLREGKRPLQVVHQGVTLPLLSEQDLTEVAVFSGLRPVQLLPHAATGEELQVLEKLGPTFVDPEGRNVGGYGAYNALTDPAHKLSVQLKVNDQKLALELAGLPGLAAFYQHDALGQLELKGYQFFDDQNRRRASYGDSQPRQVGREGEVWLPVTTPDLEASLVRFAQLRQESQSPTAARQLFELKPDAASIQGMIKQWGEARVMPAILREVEKLPTNEVVQLGQQLTLSLQFQKGFLELLQGRPETAAVAAVALMAKAGLKGGESGQAVFQAALKLPPVSTGVEVSRFLEPIVAAIDASQDYYRSQDRVSLGKSIIAILGQYQDTGAGAARLAAWEPDSPFGPARELLKNPTAGTPDELRALALGVESGDQKLRQRVLEEMKADPATARSAELAERAVGKCSTEAGKMALFRAALRHHGGEVTALLREAVEEVAPASDYHANQTRANLGSIALELLKELPETQASASRVAGWAPAYPFGPVRALLRKPLASTPEALRRVALGVEPHDQEAQKRVLDELASDPTTAAAAGVARAVWDRCPGQTGKHAAYKAALQYPSIGDGVQAARMLEIIARRIQRSQDNYYKNSNLNALGTAAIEVLQKYPDTQAAAGKVASWQPGSPHGVARALLEHPTATTPEELRQIALGADVNDTEMQKRVLTELKADPSTAAAADLGLLAMDKIYGTIGKHAVYQGALRHASISNGLEAAAMFSSVDQQIGQSQDSYKSTNQMGLGTAVLQALQQFPDTREAAGKVAAWQPGRPHGVASGLLRNPTASTPAEFRQIALQGSPGDQEMETRVLAELKADPATERAATLMQKAYDSCYSGQGKTQAMRAALAHPTVTTGIEAARMFQSALAAVRASDDSYKDNSLQALGGAALEALKSFPDTSSAAERVLAWEPGRPGAVAEALVNNPARPDLLKVALACDPSDAVFQKRRMAELPRADLVLKLYDQLYSQTAKHAAYQASLRHQKLDSGVEVAAWLQEVGGALQTANDSYKNHNFNVLGTYALDALQQYPDTKDAAARVAAWKPGLPFGPVAELLKTPNADDPGALKRYALAADPGDTSLRSNVLADRKTPTATLGKAVMEQVYSPALKEAAYRLGLSDRPIATSAQAREVLKEIDRTIHQSTDRNKPYDQQGLARAVVSVLSEYPDTKTEATRVAGWSSQPGYPVARILLENPGVLSLDAFAQGFLVLGDATKEQKVLQELASRSEKAAAIARVSCEQVEQADTRHALVLAALTTPEIRTSEDVDAYFELAAQLSRGYEPAKLKELSEVYRTGFGLGKKSGLGLAEEEQRVLVGGVVVKKR
ncbi:MAG: hypothetical protein AMXMBFR33_44940 [Candidatus Xenobia bacterium]